MRRTPRTAPNGGSPSFEKKVLFPELVSETHAVHFKDLDGDGLKDLITGKRWLSHGRSEPGSDHSPAIYWLKAAKSADGMTTFTPIVIDGVNGVVVDNVPWGEAGSGIPAFDPDFGQLTEAIERLGDDGERRRLCDGAIGLRGGERNWQRTVAGLAALVDRVV